MRLANKKFGLDENKWLLMARTPIAFSLLLAGLMAMNPVKPAISQLTQTQLQQRRISLLENALVPQTAREAAQTWAKGIKTRNGALQFAVLSPELRSKMEADYGKLNWVTGASSPWVESYKITRQVQQGGGWEFEIQYQMMTSTGSAGTQTDRIRVNKLPIDDTHPEGWYITQLSSSSQSRRSL
jgi:hypothetical protein